MKIKSIMLTIKRADGSKLEYAQPLDVEIDFSKEELLLADIAPDWLKTIGRALEKVRAEVEMMKKGRPSL